MNSDNVLGKVGKFKVCLRDEQLTSHAGVVLVHELATRLGVEPIVDEELQVKQRERGYTEGQAIGALVHNLLLGGECLSDLEVLRGDPGTQELLAQEAILAPRTAREFLQNLISGIFGTYSGSICGSSSGSVPNSAAPPAPLIWIRASMSKPPPASKARTRPTMVRSAIIPCWRFGLKRESCSSVICAAAVRIPVGTYAGFCARPSSGYPPT